MIFFLDQYTMHNADSLEFEAVFDTTKISTGSSDVNSINLPISNMDGLVVSWGDGTVNSLNSHVFADSGVKNVKIKGVIRNFRFANSGDRLKLIEIKNWGGFRINTNQIFYGCSNLTLTNVIGIPIIETSDFGSLFQNCSELTSVNNFNSWNVSTVNNLTSCFRQCVKFNQNIGGWNVGNVTSFEQLFYGCSAFNQNIGSWNVGQGVNFYRMLYGCSAFNQNIEGWNMSSATDIREMLSSCPAFNQNIGGWNVSNVTAATGFMATKTPATFSNINLDAIYNGWSSRTLKSGVSISFGSAKYTSAGQAGRDILTTTYGWTITDGGI